MDGERFDRIAWVRGTIPSRHGSSPMHRVTVSVVALVLLALLGLGVASAATGTRVARGGGEFASEAPFAFFAEKKDRKSTGWAGSSTRTPAPTRLRGGLAAWRCGARRRR